MKQGPLATLFYPFETGDIDMPAAGGHVLFLGAEPGFRLPAGFAAALTLVQGFRPDFVKLQAARHTVVAAPEGDGFDVALILAGRHRGLNEARILDAWARVRPGGLLVVSGGKEDGIDSLRKRLAGRATLEGSLSKYHGVVFWLRRDAAEAPLAPVAAPRVEDRYETAPGMFSFDRVDPASRLLAAALSDDISGRVADFCAGWGYLSVQLVARCPKMTALELFEADHASLEAARRNLAGVAVPTAFHWQDLAAEPVERRFDAVVMNPPFHQGRAAEPGIGQAMIRAASAALKPGGRLLMVANRGLPYEATLATAFRQSGEVVRDGGFKVLWGRR